VVKYHGLGHRYLWSLGFLMRPLLNGGTLGGPSKMSLREALKRVEAALGARYPASFLASVDELAALTVTSGFRCAFPMTRPLYEVEQVRKARILVGGRCLPFMHSQAKHPDIYAFEPSLAGAEAKVVVWCVHTTVYEWPDFHHFMSWVHRRCDEARASK
jgi:hypothetical protein